MSKILKRKYTILRRTFRQDLFEAAKDNKALAMLIVETYTAYRHKKHITKIWALLGFYHKEAYKDYTDKLFGKYLCSDENIWKSLYFAGYDVIRIKYERKIPETYALGDALSVAYKILKNKA